MSNEIYGFADFSDRPDMPTLLTTLRNLTPLGVFSVEKDRLIGFPSYSRPSINLFIFMIGDSKESMNAEYVLDYQDYDPHSAIKLPINADERLSLLTTILSAFFKSINCVPIAVCLTENNQIDYVKHVKVSQLSKAIKDDCSVESPPCIFYDITPEN